MARVDIKSWDDVINETASIQLKLDMYLRAGILDATAHGFFTPDDTDYYEIRPDKAQNHKEIEEIFFDWEQVYNKESWTSKRYWFLFTHPEKNLPCIVEFTAYGWKRENDDDFYKPVDKGTDLKPCPFDGGRASVDKVETAYDEHYEASCHNCCAMVEGKTEQEAREKWNKRA